MEILESVGNPPAPGIYKISNEEYHASEGISRSAISDVMLSPLDYWDNYINPNRPPRKQSEAMLLGRIINTLLIEPELFDQQYLVIKKISAATKEGKKYKAEIKAIIGNRTSVKEPLLKKAILMADSVKTHERSVQILDGAKTEHSIYWIDDETGLLCKTRPDIWNSNIGILCDLKTSRKPRPWEFPREVIKGDYHIQAAMQIDGVFKITGEKIEDFCFMVVPNERPYSPYIYHMPTAMIERGRREYKDALKIIKMCLGYKKWDLERELILPLDFTDHQLNKNSFQQLMEIYHARVNV